MLFATRKAAFLLFAMKKKDVSCLCKKGGVEVV